MKAVFLMHSYFRYNLGGAEYQSYLIAKELAKLNYEVHFIFLKEQDAVDKSEQGQAFKLHPIRKTVLKELSKLKTSYLFDVYSKLKDIQPDVIYHRNLSPFLFAATMYARYHHIKTILHISHTKDVERFRLWRRDRSLVRSVDEYFKIQGLKQVNSIISQTYEQKEELLKNYGRDSIVIRNLVEQPSAIDTKNKEDIVVWIANIKPIKNPLPYIELSKALADTGYRFLMIGRPPSGGFGEKFKKAMGQSMIEYCGERSQADVESVLDKAKILCCTSYAEGFSNTFLQAWIRRVPVVSLYVDPDDLLVKEKIGFRGESFDEFVLNVKTLMQDQSLREEMGQRAHEYVKRNHLIESNLPKIVRVLHS